MEEKLTRRKARENAFIVAFSATFDNADIKDVIALSNEEEEYALDDFGMQIIREYENHSAEINDLIRDRLQGWTMERIPRVSLVLLRNALSEMLYGPEKKPSVTINECVELAKTYGGEEDYQFVNGLLGTVVRDLQLSGTQEC